MSLDNLFGFTPGWKVDPTQDRRPGPVITYTLTPEELQKRYGHIKTTESKSQYTPKQIAEYNEKKKEMRKMGERKAKDPIGIEMEKAMVICRMYETVKDQASAVAEYFGVTAKQAQSYIMNHHIRRHLKDEEAVVENIENEDTELDEVMPPAADQEIAMINSHEEHPEPVEEIECAPPAPDVVNHPSHYNAGKYEVIDIIRSVLGSMPLKPFEAYCLGNVIKYVARCKNKGGDEDLRKARWYLDKLLEEKEG